MKTPAAWLRSCKRRKPGIYAYRTRIHLQPWKSEWGYAGQSVHLPSRDNDHNGTGQWGHVAKDWIDLKVARYVLPLPWWLGWKWVLKPLEALTIWILRPRYNVKLNPRRDKVGLKQQRIERAVRDGDPTVYRAKIARQRFINFTIRIAAVLLIVAGIGGYAWQIKS